MHARFLMATLRIPVRVGVDGDLILLNEYSKIEIGEMDRPMTTKTNETIYSKVIDYLSREDEDLKEEQEEPIQKEEEQKEPIQTEEDQKDPLQEEEEEKEPIQKEEEQKDNEKEEEEREPPKYKFPYMKKSKKPINITFRAKNKSQNFTKKMYGL